MNTEALAFASSLVMPLSDMIACEAARYLIMCLINYVLDHYNQFSGSRDPGTTVGTHCTEFPGDVRVVTSALSKWLHFLFPG